MASGGFFADDGQKPQHIAEPEGYHNKGIGKDWERERGEVRVRISEVVGGGYWPQGRHQRRHGEVYGVGDGGAGWGEW